jgi:plasmid stability protein
MGDDGMILELDAALTQSLRARAKAAGQTVEEYALDILRRAVEEPGLQDNEAQWTGARGDGAGERNAAYWRELEAICDEADQTGGIPWEQVEARLLNFGQKR